MPLSSAAITVVIASAATQSPSGVAPLLDEDCIAALAMTEDISKVGHAA